MDLFLKKINTKWKFRFFLLTKLPAAFFSGVKLILATKQSALVTIKHKFLTQNPFKSMYFASQSMAAEMCSGVLSLAHISASKKPVSMLVANLDAEFYKKATGVISFTCNDGLLIEAAVQKCIETGEGVVCKTISLGTNAQSELVSKFTIYWTYKLKTK
jgi:hypothetical protein